MLHQFFILIVFLVIFVGRADAQTPDLALEWIPLNTGTSIGEVEALDASADRLYAGTSEGVFRSENDGQTWQRIGFDFDAGDGFSIYIRTLSVDRTTVYVGTWSSGLFRSDDAGETWKPINKGLWNQRYDATDATDERVVYGGCNRILILEDTLINVMYHAGTYTSTDRGETWHDVSETWLFGDSIYAMTRFGGYLWSAISVGQMGRSADNGETWEQLPYFENDRTHDWAGVDGRLYVAAQEGVGRWNEITQAWEYPMEGLPIGTSHDPNAPPFVDSFAVRGGHLFAGLYTHGVYVFDTDSENWSPAGLQGHTVGALLSHGDALYAGTADNGIGVIYRAELRDILPVSVQPQGKATTTWAVLKQTPNRRD
jgi:hypothetical protein